MVAAKINTFGGMIPAVDDRLLPDQAAAYARNTYLYSGAIVGIPKPKILRELDDPLSGKVYRIPTNYANASYPFEGVWMEFPTTETDVIRAPVFNDTYDRYYWASSVDQPRYNTYARIAAADPAWKLGVPTPVTLPGCSVAGGTVPVVTRSYVYTWRKSLRYCR